MLLKWIFKETRRDIVEWSHLFQNQGQRSGLNIGVSQQTENLLKRGLILVSLLQQQIQRYVTHINFN